MERFVYINRIEKLGAQATILSRNPVAFAQKCPHVAPDSSITLLAGDVRDFIFPDGKFKYVIHAATDSAGRQAADFPIEMLATILRGTERVLEFAASHDTKKLLLTSSGAVYGNQPPSISHFGGGLFRRTQPPPAFLRLFRRQEGGGVGVRRLRSD